MFHPLSATFRAVLDKQKILHLSSLITSLKMAETCTRTTTCLYIIVSNYSAVAGIYCILRTYHISVKQQ